MSTVDRRSFSRRYIAYVCVDCRCNDRIFMKKWSWACRMTNVINNNERAIRGRRKFYGIYMLHQQIIHQLSRSRSYWYSFRSSFVEEVLMMTFPVCTKTISALNVRSTLHICDRNMAWNQFFQTLRAYIASKKWSTDDAPQHFFPLSKSKENHVVKASSHDWLAEWEENIFINVVNK